MAVAQEMFDIPDDLMVGLVKGELRRHGGVIRRAKGPGKGQIVKFLKPIEAKEAEQPQGVVKQFAELAKKNKNVLIIGSAGIAVVAMGGIVYHKIKKREPEALTQFRKALHTYIDEIREGKLELNTIETLMKALEELKSHEDYENFKIELTSEDLDTLVGKIYEYTIRLAENNNVELTEEEMTRTDNSILNLQNYLKTQKRIFEEAA